MPLLRRFAHWFDIRPGEGRTVTLAISGAFLVMAALTLGRALREGLYLDSFAVDTLPYVTAAVALLGLPLAQRFSHFLARYDLTRVLVGLILIEAAGLALLWLASGFEAWLRPAIVAFYLWTALGLLLLTSGFWVLTAERIPLRGAKRLYGLVSAGGTAGAMTAGLALGAVAEDIPLRPLVPLLVAILLLFMVLVLAQRGGEKRRDEEDGGGLFAGLGEVWSNAHLRVIALMVICATGASALIDFQFKEAARAATAGAADPAGALTAFLGNFYGITGALALAFQLLVSGRLMARAGLGLSLALLPTILLAGSAGFALLPGLLLITLTRGADNSLRKSLFRPALEVLYVPLPEGLRRRTKSVIDSTLDSLAEGAGAGIIFLWVTLAGFSSRWLSAGAILLAGAFLLLTRRMDRVYLGTVVERLREGEASLAERPSTRRGSSELSATFTAMDLQTLLGGLGELGVIEPPPQKTQAPAAASSPPDPLRLLRSPDDMEALRGIQQLQMTNDWDVEGLALLMRLLARDAIMERIVQLLSQHVSHAQPLLIAALGDPVEEFIIRRRIPRVLLYAGDARADEALLGALEADRFEIRYRATQALARRRRVGLPMASGDREGRIWAALRAEVTRDRPVWELQHLLDTQKESGDDEIVLERAELRGGRSLEHAFRLLSLVLEPEPVRAAFQGIVRGEEAYRGFAQEYLEQVLPADIRERLWLFVGDLSAAQKRAERRSLDAVVGDLMNSRATLFGNAEQQEALRRLLGESDVED